MTVGKQDIIYKKKKLIKRYKEVWSERKLMKTKIIEKDLWCVNIVEVDECYSFYQHSILTESKELAIEYVRKEMEQKNNYVWDDKLDNFNNFTYAKGIYKNDEDIFFRYEINNIDRICVQQEKVKDENIQAILDIFKGSFINGNNEMILESTRNMYFFLGNKETLNDLKVAVIAATCREIGKVITGKLQSDVLGWVNEFTGLSLTDKDMLEIYTIATDLGCLFKHLENNPKTKEMFGDE